MRLAAVLLAAWGWAAKALAPSPSDYVHNEQVVSPACEARLTARLAAFERETKKQFVVALFQSLEGESLEDYSNRLFRHWKIGDARKNDGLLLALYKQDRKWRVEVGYGLEGTIPDAEAGRIAREYGVPHFKDGHFDQGVEAVVEALEAKIRGKAPPRLPAPPRAPPNRDVFDFGDKLLLVFVLIVFVIALNANGGSTGSGSDWSSSDYSSSSSWDSGGFSGGGGSSGGGGASGGW